MTSGSCGSSNSQSWRARVASTPIAPGLRIRSELDWERYSKCVTVTDAQPRTVPSNGIASTATEMTRFTLLLHGDIQYLFPEGLLTLWLLRFLRLACVDLRFRGRPVL